MDVSLPQICNLQFCAKLIVAPGFTVSVIASGTAMLVDLVTLLDHVVLVTSVEPSFGLIPMIACWLPVKL